MIVNVINRPRLAVLMLALLAAVSGPPATSMASDAVPVGPSVSVIVRELPGSGDAPERAVARLGGHVSRHLGIIDGFVASVPADGLRGLRSSSGVHSVTRNRAVRLLHAVDGYQAHADPSSMFNVVRDTIGATEMWGAGYSGAGVDVAVIDSGVVPVDGLQASGKVVNGPDLSYESGHDALRHLDTYGHGTHIAGMIAGRDDAVASPVRKAEPHRFLGVAPDARIVNLKVADSSGATDVSQIIAAIDWVVEHRNDNGLDIRVLNLSFGTDGVQDYRIDPLAHAAEVAWHKGVVVVVAGGNEGYGSAKLNDPAYNPYVLAVGGTAANETSDPADDTVPEWSSRGDAARGPDLVAPGQAMISLRAPGSHLDLTYPGARIGSRFFRGSGTSQAAAVVSGAAALLLDQRPDLTPDQVKALLMSTARPLREADAAGQGAGMLDLEAAMRAPTPAARQAWQRSVGTGSLELARGSAHVEVGGTVISGEVDVFGGTWDPVDELARLLFGSAWSGDWSGSSWSGPSWSGGTWLGNSWAGNWSGGSWSGRSWSGGSWSGGSWSGGSWSGGSWSGGSWSSAGW
jgi:serine protease AprX